MSMRRQFLRKGGGRHLAKGWVYKWGFTVLNCYSTMECGLLCQLPWYVCCGKDSSVCMGVRSPVPYILPMCAEHGCLPPPGPMCTLFPFSEDSFLPSFQLLISPLCHPSFSCVFLIPLYFTFSCVCVWGGWQLYFRRVLCPLLLIL